MSRSDGDADCQASGPAATVVAPARLHLGFLDLHGGLGRRFGGIGVALNEPCTRVSARRAASLRADGPGAERALGYARTLLEELGLSAGAHLEIEETIPAHAGLGSGTQLALAVGAALAGALDLELTPREVAGCLDRGARSGIGLAAFEHGGFLVDGGRGASRAPPPLICRLRFPSEWRFVLVFDHAREGVHGSREIEAFERLPEFPAACAEQACRLVLMQLLPALAEADARGFGAAVTELQGRVGDHFAAVQGGRFSSPRVEEAALWLARNGAAGVGQSSWGPTGFALCEDEALARRLVREVEARGPRDGSLSFRVCRARNEPGTVRRREAAVHA